MAVFFHAINKFYHAIRERETFIFSPLSFSLVPLVSRFLRLFLSFRISFSLSFSLAYVAGEWWRIGEVIQEVGYNFNDGVSARADY